MDEATLKPLIDEDLYPCIDRIIDMCHAPYMVENGLELVHASRNSVRMRKVLRPSDMNSMGRAHGAVIFGIIDHTFAITCNMNCDATGQSCNIIYHRPCMGETIETESSLINESRSLAIYDVKAYSNGKLVASATCTAFKINK